MNILLFSFVGYLMNTVTTLVITIIISIIIVEIFSTALARGKEFATWRYSGLHSLVVSCSPLHWRHGNESCKFGESPAARLLTMARGRSS